MRKVVLDNLPRTYKGIDWDMAVGIPFEFTYDEIVGEIIILSITYLDGNKKLNIKCLYDGIEKTGTIGLSNIKKCKLGRILNGSSLHKYKVGEHINSLEILEQTRINKNNNRSEKGYLIKCDECNESFYIFETSISRGGGCKYCNGNRNVKEKVNDIATTHPDLVKYFVNKEDAYKYSYGSTKKVMLKCLVCGNQRLIKINRLTNSGISCDMCSDGFSYPNKLMSNILKQLNVNYTTEYSPEWIKPKRYDFYLQDQNIIIEMDGGFHDTDNNMSGVTSLQMKSIDLAKDKAAQNKGISVIRIDSKLSKLAYIKENITNSMLSELLDLTCIDWIECDSFASASRIKEACDLWNNGVKSTIKIASIMGVERTSVCYQLKKGKDLGLCDYDVAQVKTQKGIISGKQKAKKVLFIELNKTFESVVYLSSVSEEICGVKLNKTSIAEVCRGKIKSHHGFHFKYV